MKLIIAGGRDFIPNTKHLQFLLDIKKKHNILEVVSGKAKGADTFGELFAKYYNIKVTPFKADWKDIEGKPEHQIKENTYGKYWIFAGNYRNELMAKYADAVVLFKGGSGTDSMEKLAKQYKLQIFKYKDKDFNLF